jgi:hypothetical protein
MTNGITQEQEQETNTVVPLVMLSPEILDRPFGVDEKDPNRTDVGSNRAGVRVDGQHCNPRSLGHAGASTP